MSANEWVGMIVGITVLLATTLGIIRWVIRNEVRDIKAETTANGGGSMNDKVKLEILPLLKEIREDQIKIGLKVATLDGKFEQHIKEHQ